MSAETPGVTPRTPGLDPEPEVAVPVWALRVLRSAASRNPDFGHGHSSVTTSDRYRNEACIRCRAANALDAALAALPSSLLDNPEADR